MFLNIMTSLSFCLCHLFIKDIWDIQRWGHITLQLLLYSVWQSTLLGTGREKILLSLFLLSFFSPLFSFHKILFFFPHTFEFSSSSPSFPWPQFLSDGIQWFFFPLKNFHHCVWGLNNRHTQFISGCCCLAVLWEATATPELVTNRGRCKVRKFFASITCRSCIFQNRC